MVEYYIATKRDDILTCSTTWINLNNTNEPQQPIKKDHVLFCSICMYIELAIP